MGDEQKIVVNWIQRVMRDQDLSAAQWAGQAGVAATSITRAMRESYGGTSTLPLLHRLARAAEVPSPLDFLAAMAGLPTRGEIEAALRGAQTGAGERPVDPALLADVVYQMLHHRS